MISELQASIEKASSIKTFYSPSVSASTGGITDDNHHLCIFSMDTSEVTEHSLIFLFFLVFMKISEL